LTYSPKDPFPFKINLERAQFHLVRLYSLLVLGRLEADQRNLLCVASGRVARGLDGSVVGGYAGIGAVGMATRSPFVHHGLRRSGARQPLCARGVYLCAWTNGVRDNGFAQPARSSDRLQSLLSTPLASPVTKAGCPIQAVLWLEGDTPALDAPFLSLGP
jgi:hypothetical protein